MEAYVVTVLCVCVWCGVYACVWCVCVHTHVCVYVRVHVCGVCVYVFAEQFHCCKGYVARHTHTNNCIILCYGTLYTKQFGSVSSFTTV